MTLINLLSGGRAAIGAAAWTAPRLTARALGMHPRRSAGVEFLVRLFAIRDIALAAGLALSPADSRRLWLALAMACDGADATAALLAARSGGISAPVAGLVSAPALLGVGLGLAALREGGARPPQ